jgi:hypothetical protein
MPRYLIEVPHGDEREACLKALNAINSYGSHFVTRAEWGCRDGDHSCWMIAELNTKNEAIQLLHPSYRQDARVVELSRFTPEEIRSLVDELEG